MTGIRILVTGAAGFLGWSFVKLLVDEDRCYRFRKNISYIRCLDVQEPPFQQLKNENKIQLEYVKADITDPIAMKQATKGINSIFHFAAVISFNYFDSEERVQKINFGGTKNLIEAGIENGVDRFL